RSVCEARRPLVITSYLGRQRRAVDLMVELSGALGIGVCEVSPQYLNFPGDDPHHLGYRRDSFVDEADLILMIDVDVPWIPAKVHPAKGAKVLHIDIDPLKQTLGYWHFPANQAYQSDSFRVLEQLLAVDEIRSQRRESRRSWIESAKARCGLPVSRGAGGAITAEELTEALRDLVSDRTIIITEAPSGTELIPSVLRMNRPGSYFASGGSGLGWGINAAIGAKLANPEAEVISLVGDGSYQFGVPSSAYWTASTYHTTHLTIIYNNGGWHSPKLSTLWVHPDGVAAQADAYWVTMNAGARLADVAAASGDVAAFTVRESNDLRPTLQAALEVVRGGRSAVVDVVLPPISSQTLR